jgi:hypothetical protein
MILKYNQQHGYSDQPPHYLIITPMHASVNKLIYIYMYIYIYVYVLISSYVEMCNHNLP